MTVKFDAWGGRDRVVLMLEAPTRIYFSVVPEDEGYAAQADIDTILAELDRMDKVTAAKRALSHAEALWKQAIVTDYVKIVPATGGEECTTPSRERYSYKRATSRHKAKVILNGIGYCGTHLVRAERLAEDRAIRDHRDEYVPDAANEAIVEADKALRIERSGR